MGIVFAGALIFSIYSFCHCQILNGLGYILTALIPISVWFLDDRENKERDEKFVKLKDTVESYGLKVIDNPEFIYAITDAEDKLLFGIHRDDGSIVFGAGTPKSIQDELEQLRNEIAELKKKQ